MSTPAYSPAMPSAPDPPASRPAGAPAPPQRGPRPPSDRRLRGARGVPGAGRVAQPPAAARQRRSASRPARSSPPSSPTSRSSSPCCAWPTRSRAARAAASSRVVKAVELLSPEAVQALATRARTFDFFERSSVWDAAPERFRLHGVATQRAADRLATETGYERPRPPDGHRAAARHRQARPHARLPGLPARRSTRARARPRSASTASAASSASTTRWSAASSPAAGACPRPSPRSSSATTPRTPTGEAAYVRLADMLAHYAQGQAGLADRAAEDRPRASASGRRSCARSCTTCRTRRPARQRQIDPCPLSDREVEVLKRLAEGKVYKQIAHELVALDEHGAHAPAQHLRQARRGRPRPGRPARHRARLAVSPRTSGSGSREPARVAGSRGSRWPALEWLPPCSRSRPSRPYALKALAELGRSAATAPVPIGELARRRDIPVQFLEQLFASLRRAGVLQSQRGVKGGYSFARDPARDHRPRDRRAARRPARPRRRGRLRRRRRRRPRRPREHDDRRRRRARGARRRRGDVLHLSGRPGRCARHGRGAESRHVAGVYSARLALGVRR